MLLGNSRVRHFFSTSWCIRPHHTGISTSISFQVPVNRFRKVRKSYWYCTNFLPSWWIPRPSMLDFKKNIFWISEACSLTLCRSRQKYLQFYLKSAQHTVKSFAIGTFDSSLRWISEKNIDRINHQFCMHLH